MRHTCSKHVETPLANECVIGRQEDGVGKEVFEQSKQYQSEFVGGPIRL